jgi:hypothetical protein
MLSDIISKIFGFFQVPGDFEGVYHKVLSISHESKKLDHFAGEKSNARLLKLVSFTG